MVEGSGSAGLGRLPWTLSAEELRRTAGEIVADATERLDALLRSTDGPGVETFLRPLDRILLMVRDVSAHGSFLFAVHPDPAVRTAGREVSEAADRFFNGFRIDDRVYRALGAIDLAQVDPTTRFAVERMRREMRRSGVEQDAESRARLVALNNLIDRIGNQKTLVLGLLTMVLGAFLFIPAASVPSVAHRRQNKGVK